MPPGPVLSAPSTPHSRGVCWCPEAPCLMAAGWLPQLQTESGLKAGRRGRGRRRALALTPFARKVKAAPGAAPVRPTARWK